MLEHRDVSPHPGMNIALHRNRNFLTRKGLFKRNAVRLSHVPLPIIVGSRMNIVSGFVAIHDLKLLSGLERQYVGLVLAAFLFESGRLRRRLKVVGGESI